MFRSIPRPRNRQGYSKTGVQMMNRWDNHTAPTLRTIAELSIEIASRARHLQSALRDLPARPDFVTKAEDELRMAEKLVAETMLLLSAAREQYAALPVMKHLEAAE